MTILHQSGLRLAADCLASFHAKYIRGVKDSSNPALAGTAVHKCIEKGYIASATGNVSQADAAIAYLDVYEKAHPEIPGVVIDAAERGLRRIYSTESSLYLRLPGRGDTMAVEWEWGMTADFKACKTDDPECAYAGRIDEVRWGVSGIRQRDWKFVNGWRKKDDLKDDTQMLVYSRALLAAFPQAHEVTSGWVMLKHDYEVSDTFRRGEAWQGMIERWMARQRERVLRAEERDEWPETHGDACPYCPVKHVCATHIERVECGTILPDEPILETALRWMARGRPDDADKRKLKKHCDATSIDLRNGKTLGFKPVEVTQWRSSIPGRVELLRQSGATEEDLVEWFPAKGVRATFNKDGMKRALTELAVRGEIEDPDKELMSMQEKVPGVRFTVFANPEPEEEETDD